MTPQQLKKEHPELHRELRASGARSLAKLGRDMRAAQNRYFRTRSNESLKLSKKLEEQFDATVNLIISQP